MPFWLQKTLYFLLKTLLVVACLFIGLKLLRYMAPFLLAFVLSAALEPVVRFLEKKLRIPRRFGAVLSILLVLGSVGTVIGLITARLVREISNLYEAYSNTFGDLTTFFNRMMDEANRLYIQLPKEVTDAIDSTVSALGSTLKDLLGKLASSTLKFTISVPEAVVFVLVAILATYFMISDRKSINSAFERWVPKSWLRNTRRMVLDIFKALFGWLRAQGIIMSITFTILLAGLLIAGVDNPLILALLTAVIDALPVFGAGAVLIPWGITSLVLGHYKLGIFLLLLDVVILVVRHLIEPRIVGRQIGIHPLLTLLGMYLGLQWIGVLGMLMGPICMVILKVVLDRLMKTDRVMAFMRRLFQENGANPSGSGPVAEDGANPPGTGPVAADGHDVRPPANVPASIAENVPESVPENPSESVPESPTENPPENPPAD